MMHATQQENYLIVLRTSALEKTANSTFQVTLDISRMGHHLVLQAHPVHGKMSRFLPHGTDRHNNLIRHIFSNSSEYQQSASDVLHNRL